MRIFRRRWPVLLPLVVGVLAAALLLLARLDFWFHLSARASAVDVVAGLLVTLLWAGVLWHRHRLAAVGAAAEQRVLAQERSSRQRFMRRLDHEMKNPVTAIRTALAAEPTSSPPLRVAASQAARLSSLVGDLAKLAELETRPLERVPVDLEEVALEAVEAVEAVRPGRSLRVEFPTVPWPVPSVMGDRDLLVVAIYNLVLNAVKYSDEDARVEVRGSEADGVVSLEVSDTGWGMSAEDLASVWEELARGENARAVEGSGLGLSIVRAVCERHGATSAVQSAPGRGTRIVLRMPAAQEPMP